MFDFQKEKVRSSRPSPDPDHHRHPNRRLRFAFLRLRTSAICQSTSLEFVVPFFLLAGYKHPPRSLLELPDTRQAVLLQVPPLLATDPFVAGSLSRRNYSVFAETATTSEIFLLFARHGAASYQSGHHWLWPGRPHCCHLSFSSRAQTRHV